MAAVTKFRFDIAFDAVDQFTAAEEEEILPPEPTFSEAEMAAAREQGYAEGFQAASAEAQASIETATAGALEEITRQLTEMESVLTDGLQGAQKSALELSSVIARKMVDKSALDTALPAIERIVTEILGQVLEEPRVVIRVNDQILDSLKENLSVVTQKSGFPGSIILLGEPGIEIPNCRIEWADGGADFACESIWAEIDGIIERHTMAIGAEEGETADQPPPIEATTPEHVISEEQSNG